MRHSDSLAPNACVAVCKVMGELLSGSVGATSAPGLGSTFWLRMRAEWYAEQGASGGGTGTDSGELVADGVDEARAAAAAGVIINPALRQRRGAPAGVRTPASVDEASDSMPSPPATAPPSTFSSRFVQSRRHSLDGWTQQARHALGSPQTGPLSAGRPGGRRLPGSMDSGSGRPFASAPPAAGSLAASLAAVAAAHATPGAGTGGTASGNAASAAVSHALLHAVRTLREALDDAEVAVAWRLGDPAEWLPPERLSRDSSAGGPSGRPSADHGTLPPAAVAAAPPATPLPAAPAPTPASASALRNWPGALRSVLVVDDEPVNTALVARRLKREAPDVAVTLAEDGAEMVALTVEQRRRYDVVLMDQHMRGMNGDAAVAALRAFEAAEGLQRSLVIACTGNACEPDLALFAAAGFDGVITKPLDMSSLVSTLAALMRGTEAAIDNVHIFPCAAPLADA
jgi:CheY-like chemotaxis protein